MAKETEEKKLIDEKKPAMVRFAIGCKSLQKVLLASEPAHTYKYCTIQSLLKEIRESFSPIGIGVFQYVKLDEYNLNIIKTLVFDLMNPEKDKAILFESTIKIPDHLKEKEKLIELDKYYLDHPKEAPKNKYGHIAFQANNYNLNQEIGASITYLRRYALYTLLNVHPEKDGDGESYLRKRNK